MFPARQHHCISLLWMTSSHIRWRKGAWWLGLALDPEISWGQTGSRDLCARWRAGCQDADLCREKLSKLLSPGHISSLITRPQTGCKDLHCTPFPLAPSRDPPTSQRAHSPSVPVSPLLWDAPGHRNPEGKYVTKSDIFISLVGPGRFGSAGQPGYKNLAYYYKAKCAIDTLTPTPRLTTPDPNQAHSGVKLEIMEEARLHTTLVIFFLSWTYNSLPLSSDKAIPHGKYEVLHVTSPYFSCHSPNGQL